MSKYVKELLTQDLKSRLDGVEDALIVSLTGMDANATVKMRDQLHEKGIRVMVVKNSLARRATEGTSLAPAFEGLKGSSAVVWGAEDFVSLSKEVVKLDGDEELEHFVTRGGAMDGEPLTPAKVKEISKWPSRTEQLSLLIGQILGPGRTLAAQVTGPGSHLAAQIKTKSEDE
ncbi:MAG: 50S ribosomal protein L10 [Pirellulaceae bacterium]|nr:50S ribosomal protein L10 [Pirellulaceae bacterium]